MYVRPQVVDNNGYTYRCNNIPYVRTSGHTHTQKKSCAYVVSELISLPGMPAGYQLRNSTDLCTLYLTLVGALHQIVSSIMDDICWGTAASPSPLSWKEHQSSSCPLDQLVCTYVFNL